MTNKGDSDSDSDSEYYLIYISGECFFFSTGDEKTIQWPSLHGEMEMIIWVMACRGDTWVFVLGFGLVWRLERLCSPSCLRFTTVRSLGSETCLVGEITQSPRMLACSSNRTDVHTCVAHSILAFSFPSQHTFFSLSLLFSLLIKLPSNRMWLITTALLFITKQGFHDVRS